MLSTLLQFEKVNCNEAILSYFLIIRVLRERSLTYLDIPRTTLVSKSFKIYAETLKDTSERTNVQKDLCFVEPRFFNHNKNLLSHVVNIQYEEGKRKIVFTGDTKFLD